MNLRLVFANLRLVIWPLCMAYAAFLLADTKSVSSLSVMITAAFLGAMIGFCLGIMFANRAVRRRRENVLGVLQERTGEVRAHRQRCGVP
jgi:TRAP-type uncharacterized transport system fused permease subunit